MRSTINRRNFLKYSASAIPVSALYLNGCNLFNNQAISEKIVRIEIVNYKGPIRTDSHLEIESSKGMVGVFGPMGWGLPELMKDLLKSLMIHSTLVYAREIDGRMDLDEIVDFLGEGFDMTEPCYTCRPLFE